MLKFICTFMTHTVLCLLESAAGAATELAGSGLPAQQFFNTLKKEVEDCCHDQNIIKLRKLNNFRPMFSDLNTMKEKSKAVNYFLHSTAVFLTATEVENSQGSHNNHDPEVDNVFRLHV